MSLDIYREMSCNAEPCQRPGKPTWNLAEILKRSFGILKDTVSGFSGRG